MLRRCPAAATDNFERLGKHGDQEKNDRKIDENGGEEEKNDGEKSGDEENDEKGAGEKNREKSARPEID